MPSPSSKLKALQKKSVEKGHWQVVAAVSALMADESSLDARINLVGAMHEVGLLSNSLEPWWKEWRADDQAAAEWTGRCLDRLKSVDTDYWALAGLLGLPLDIATGALAARGYHLLGIRYATTYKDGRWLIATFCLQRPSPMSRVVAPIIEIGWSEGVVTEASRWRAVILSEQGEVAGNLFGKGSGTYYLRAKLPNGCWRIAEDDFELREDWMVPKAETPLAEYPAS